MIGEAIREAMAHLASHRPVFHAEADFQFALAWRLQEKHPETGVRLERPLGTGADRIWVDIVTEGEGRRAAVELKYRTRALEATAGGEAFDLKAHSASDQGRYGLLRDICRVEGLVASGLVDEGAALILTNDRSLWSDVRGVGTNDEAFRLFEGRVVQGPLSWAEKASEGTTQGMTHPIMLSGSYTISWQPYSVVSGHEFRYLLIEV